MVVRVSTFSTLSNIGVRRLSFRFVGDEVETHDHDFAHTLFCVAGDLEVWSKAPSATERQRARLLPGDTFVVAAGEEHGMRALSDRAEAACIFAHRDPQGEVVQGYPGAPC